MSFFLFILLTAKALTTSQDILPWALFTTSVRISIEREAPNGGDSDEFIASVINKDESLVRWDFAADRKLTEVVNKALPWTKEMFEIVMEQVEAAKVDQLPHYPHFEYPLGNIESLSDLATERLTLFAYGSLLNQDSASQTLSKEAIMTYEPAVVFGYSRTFDRHVPTTSHWGEKVRPNDTAMLNLFESDGMVNGVIFKVTTDELMKVIKREVGYDLEPVIAVPWSDESFEPLVVYTFVASSEAREGQYFTRRDINPVPGYAVASQKGAFYWGKHFELFWIHSTYLSDRKTPYWIWLSDPSIDMKCCH